MCRRTLQFGYLHNLKKHENFFTFEFMFYSLYIKLIFHKEKWSCVFQLVFQTVFPYSVKKSGKSGLLLSFVHKIKFHT